jgi:diguanylate cyclase (GGDEF)-like protein
MDHLAAALQRVARSRHHLAVLFVDLDDFKQVNDQLGHEAGDELLVETAARLRQALRGRDVVARLGGDEFVIVCEELSEPGEVETLVRRVEHALAAPLELHGRPWNLSASIGVAVNRSSRGPEGLLRDADTAMYRAKARGNGHFEIADGSLQAGAARRRHLLEGLAAAVEDHQLRLEYQPCVELVSNRVVALEALLRWDHPEAGLLLPGEFLHVADREGFAETIGDWVIAETCRQAAAWRERHGDAAPAVWVNISCRQLGRHRLLARIRAACTEHGLPLTMLGLEISEPEVSGASQQARAELHTLHRSGVRLAVDHFRIGRNSISYLRELPIDRLKLDRTLVAGLGHDRADTAVASSAATLAGGLELELVAEGVETREQRDALRAIGCDLAQGYLFARPRPPEEVSAALP